MYRASRRNFLGLLVASHALAGNRRLGSSPLISVQDFEQYPDIVTPRADFYVRNHFAMPALDASEWKLRIGGLVSQSKTLSLAELRAEKQSGVTAVMECAGNGVGVGAVGCANWQGVALSEFLRACGVKPEAKYVRFTGADRGREPDGPEVTYSRCLKLDDAMRPATLLALGMNGAALEPEHGFPARVVVPGRYGMDSVKWLRSIEALAEPDDSYYMVQRFRRVSHATVGEPVGQIRVKSILVKPAANSVVRGVTLEAGGYAWAGFEAVKKVEVRLDGGEWRAGRMLASPKPLTWSAWAFSARMDKAGAHSVESRATSVSGETQPLQRDAFRDDEYELNQVQNVRFFWRP